MRSRPTPTTKSSPALSSAKSISNSSRIPRLSPGSDPQDHTYVPGVTPRLLNVPKVSNSEVLEKSTWPEMGKPPGTIKKSILLPPAVWPKAMPTVSPLPWFGVAKAPLPKLVGPVIGPEKMLTWS